MFYVLVVEFTRHYLIFSKISVKMFDILCNVRFFY